MGLPVRMGKLGYCFSAPFGVIMPGCDLVQPDFTIVTAARNHIITDKGVRGVPDALIEILSPHHRAYDLDDKRAAYATAGVPEYGILDPDKRLFMLYALEAIGLYGEPRTFRGDDPITFACLPTISFTVNDLFLHAPDELWKPDGS